MKRLLFILFPLLSIVFSAESLAALALEKLYDFQPRPAPSNPLGGVIHANDGNIYGTTCAGSANGNDSGTVFRITPDKVFSVVHSFQANTEGACPTRLIQGKNGYLYGLTNQGGTFGGGTLFRLSLSKSFTVLHQFNPSSEGYVLESGIVQASDGNLYGLLSKGLGGAVYRFTISNSSFDVIYRLSERDRDSSPSGTLIQSKDGNLYGTTPAGGVHGYGSIFAIDPTDSFFRTVYSFSGNTEGCSPRTGVVSDANGNLYGVASGCGKNFGGTVFRLDTSGVLATLYAFSPMENDPSFGLIRGTDGNLYGNTMTDGLNSRGVIFMVAPGTGKYSAIANFPANPTSNCFRHALTEGYNGDLYGTIGYCGSSNNGMVYRVRTMLPIASPQLAFPLQYKGWTQYTASIEAALDHSLTTGTNCPDNTVVAYTGERGTAQYGVSQWYVNGNTSCGQKPLYGFKQSSGQAFRINGQYSSDDLRQDHNLFLFYDGHAGYDYAVPVKTQVFAALSGKIAKTMDCPANGSPCTNMGRLGVTNPVTGYTAWCLHLSKQTGPTTKHPNGLNPGDTVVKGELIGYSGNTGSGANHLHFEVRRENGTTYGVPVDPYGWKGLKGKDPLAVGSSKYDNVCLWSACQ